jgi:hypothetical protein
MKRLFAYIENIWIGRDKKPSRKAILAIAFSINFMMNISHAIYKWDSGRSVSDLAMVLGIEAGLIAGLLGLSTYSNIEHRRIDKDRDRSRVDNPDIGPEE